VEVRATSVGPDLARCIARIDKRRHPDANSGDSPETAAADNAEGATGEDGEAAVDADPAGADSAPGGKALPLSA